MAKRVENSASGRRLADLLREEGTVLLDTADVRLDDGVMLFFESPVKVVTANRPGEVRAALSAAEDYVAAGYWVAGFVSYEVGYALEARFREENTEAPLIWFGIYGEPVRVAPEIMEDCLAELAAAEYTVGRSRLGTSRQEYVECVEAIRHHIREGDVYQINFTFPFLFDFDGDTRAFYRDLRVAQPVPYGAYINTGATVFLSLSPELFFERRKRRIVARPMKGTAAAKPLVLDDVKMAARLRSDPKNRAENLMIVDLLRNDLSRCCEPGSVIVPELFSVHHYPSVLQMTSTIEGMLREDCGYRQIFESLFPCGSVTGAPKIRAMEIIAELEPDPRGVYCGAIGFISPDEEATFSVAIRTIALSGREGRMGTGSGIVWDSNAREEFDECLLKTQFVRRAAGLPL